MSTKTYVNDGLYKDADGFTSRKAIGDRLLTTPTGSWFDPFQQYEEIASKACDDLYRGFILPDEYLK